MDIKSIDFQDDANGRKFSMQDHAGSEEGVRMIEADEDGVMKFRVIFDDSHEPTLGGGEFRAQSRLVTNRYTCCGMLMSRQILNM